MKKQNQLMICLVAGVLMLAVSATAAFGSVNGYTKYKNAVKALALQEGNFTAAGTLAVKLDEKEVMKLKTDYTMAAPDFAQIATSTQNGKTFTEYTGSLNGVYTIYNDQSDTYYQYQSDAGQENLLGYDGSDETQKRLVTFLELAADTVMGDLKNNFVETGSKDGSTLYQVNIANSQVPSLVNAGLSLFACALAEDQSTVRDVEYEDYDANVLAYYEKTTGETLSEEFKANYRSGWDDAWYEANEAQVEKFCEVTAANWEAEYYQILDQKGAGVVYVHADGTYDYYPTMQDYVEAHPDGDIFSNLYYYVGKDLVLDNVACTFGVDKSGKLTSNRLDVTFTSTDLDGSRHKLVLSGDLRVSDYGTTVVKAPDLQGKTKAHY